MKQVLIVTETYNGETNKICVAENIYKDGFGDYYFLNEASDFDGPYASLDQCRRALQEYCENL